MHFTELPTGERFIYEWQSGINRGSFMGALADAMAHADSVNLDKFRSGFPEEAEGMWRWRYDHNFWPNVTNKLMDQSTTVENGAVATPPVTVKPEIVFDTFPSLR